MQSKVGSYKRRGKRPFRYSAEHRQWQRAAKAGQPTDALSEAHDLYVLRARGPMPGWSGEYVLRLRKGG